MKLKKLVWPLLLLVALCLISGGCGGGSSSSFYGNSGGGSGDISPDVSPDISPDVSPDVPTPAWVGSYHGNGTVTSGDDSVSADVIIDLAQLPQNTSAWEDKAMFSSYIIVGSKIVDSQDKVDATVVVDDANSNDFTVTTDDGNTELSMTVSSDSSFVMTGNIGNFEVENFAVTKADSDTPTDDTISASDLAGRWKIDALVLSGDNSTDVSASFDSSILITENNLIILHVLNVYSNDNSATSPTIESLDLGKISFTKIAGSYYKLDVSSDYVTSDSSIVFDSATTATAYFDFAVSRDTDVINIAGTYDLTKVTDAIKISSADLFGTWSGTNFVALRIRNTSEVKSYDNVPVVLALSMDTLSKDGASYDVPVFYMSADVPGVGAKVDSFDLNPELVFNVDDTLVYAITRGNSYVSIDTKIAITESSDKESAQVIWSTNMGSTDVSLHISMVGNIEKIMDTVSHDYFYPTAEEEEE